MSEFDEFSSRLCAAIATYDSDMRRTYFETRVSDIDEAIRFYSAIFDREPTHSSPDHAYWSMDDPGIDFAITVRPGGPTCTSSVLS